jgi:Domain of unknown function (DUF4164)
LPSHKFHRRGDGLAAADGGTDDGRDDGMSVTDSIEIASRRLALALDALEAAAERCCETGRSEEALATQIHALGTDRARLASELDSATARSRALEAANREVAQRIAQAIETIRGLLASEQ